MTTQNLIEKIEDTVKKGIVETVDYDKYPIIWVEPKMLTRVVKTLKEELSFDWLSFVTAVDKRKHLELVYMFYSTENHNRICVKIRTDKKGGTVPSIYETFEGAAWHENEVYDLFGVKFENHPYPRRIFTTPDIKGYPLLKDFQHPKMVSSKASRKPEIPDRTEKE